MEKKIRAMKYALIFLFFFFFFSSSLISAQAQNITCLNQLSPCLNYLNGNRDPPNSCCDPLKDMIKSDPQCICYMISNQGAFTAQMIGINVTEAQELPARCGELVNPLVCLSSSPTARSSNQGSSGAPSFSYPTLRVIVMVVFLQICVRVL